MVPHHVSQTCCNQRRLSQVIRTLSVAAHWHEQNPDKEWVLKWLFYDLKSIIYNFSSPFFFISLSKYVCIYMYVYILYIYYTLYEMTKAAMWLRVVTIAVCYCFMMYYDCSLTCAVCHTMHIHHRNHWERWKKTMTFTAGIHTLEISRILDSVLLR